MASITDFPSVENTFQSLSKNNDIIGDKASEKAWSLMYIYANVALDSAGKCKINNCLNSLILFNNSLSALMRRKYATTEDKPCRWANKETEKSITSLNIFTRESIIKTMSNECNLTTR